MNKNKIWNGRKYFFLKNRWVRTDESKIKLAWDVWNYYNVNNIIKYKDGNVIHHINRNSLDDRIENLEKMSRRNHQIFHQKGRNGRHYNLNNQTTKCMYKNRIMKVGDSFFLSSITIDGYRYREKLNILKGGVLHLCTIGGLLLI